MLRAKKGQQKAQTLKKTTGFAPLGVITLCLTYTKAVNCASGKTRGVKIKLKN